MPIYDFVCLRCEKRYEELTQYDEKGLYKKVKCPYCKSKRKSKTYDYNITCTFDNPKESSKWESDTYREGYNMAKAKAERRAAEAKSHMGTNPYGHVKY